MNNNLLNFCLQESAKMINHGCTSPATRHSATRFLSSKYGWELALAFETNIALHHVDQQQYHVALLMTYQNPNCTNLNVWPLDLQNKYSNSKVQALEKYMDGQQQYYQTGANAFNLSCKICHGRNFVFHNRQVRSADEGETTYAICANCPDFMIRLHA